MEKIKIGSDLEYCRSSGMYLYAGRSITPLEAQCSLLIPVPISVRAGMILRGIQEEREGQESTNYFDSRLVHRQCLSDVLDHLLEYSSDLRWWHMIAEYYTHE